MFINTGECSKYFTPDVHYSINSDKYSVVAILIFLNVCI